ncbi:unnamed protein product [Moneuplotes crassus]|uniref:Uncharacterized protein n=1 Tax=Euplotes crassus TaxID=5936 RepID=A0AAD1UF20_EUPCR|nr:unnamed protein product [Moneuplotes crassus]
MGCARSKEEPYCIRRRVNQVISEEKINDNCTRLKFFTLPTSTKIGSSTSNTTKINSDLSKLKELAISNSKGLPKGRNISNSMSQGQNLNTIEDSQLSEMNNFLISHPPDNSILDNCYLIKENPDAQIHKVEIFGTNYVEAIQLEHIIKNSLNETRTITSFACGSRFDMKNMTKPACEITLGATEVIDSITLCCNVGTRRIRGIVLGTNSERCAIMEGEIEAEKFVDLPESARVESDVEVMSEEQLSSCRDVNFGHLSSREISFTESNAPKVESRRGDKPYNDDYLRLSSRENNFRYQIMNLYEMNRHLIGLKCKFEDYLVDFEIYQTDIYIDEMN